eukprot:gene11834-24814_t
MLTSDFSPDHIRLLLVSDVDILSASRLAEFFVPKPPHIDCCIVCGPFTHSDIVTREDEAVAEGDMASTIAQLENIVCRVVYLPSDRDPVTSLAEQLNLTPNSVCIHARMMTLIDGLYIAGFAEKQESLAASSTDGPDVMDDIDDDTDAYDVKSSSTMNIIHEILSNIIDISTNSTALKTDENINKLPSTLFILNYKFAHTLNQFLFNNSNILQKAGISLCIAPNSMQTNAPDIPSKIGNIPFIVPQSLRLGHYVIIDMNLTNCDGAESWKISQVAVLRFALVIFTNTTIYPIRNNGTRAVSLRGEKGDRLTLCLVNNAPNFRSLLMSSVEVLVQRENVRMKLSAELRMFIGRLC